MGTFKRPLARVDTQVGSEVSLFVGLVTGMAWLKRRNNMFLEGPIHGISFKISHFEMQLSALDVEFRLAFSIVILKSRRPHKSWYPVEGSSRSMLHRFSLAMPVIGLKNRRKQMGFPKQERQIRLPGCGLGAI